MHPSSLENMEKCRRRFFLPSPLARRPRVRVLELGGADLNGSFRGLFSGPRFDYRTADISPGPGVDLVLADPYQIPLPSGSLDLVLSGQMLEHSEFFWRAFQEMVRLLSPEGFLFLIAPSAGPIHRFPVDCYRFYPDAYHALARYAGCHLQALWHDERGPWRDLVGVFRAAPPAGPAPPAGAEAPPVPEEAPAPGAAFDAAPEEEAVAGQGDYLEVLGAAQEALAPRLYLEIGVRHGRSLALAKGPALGVDPAPDLRGPLGPATRVIQATSDDFFDLQADGLIGGPVDLGFIDGMHRFEYALRDWMALERRADPAGLLAIDDCFPNHPRQALRERATQVWTGDVWRLAAVLRAERPDLLLVPLDTRPTGLLLAAGLDPANRVLWDGYNPLVKGYRDGAGPEPPAWVLARQGALAPHHPLVGELLGRLRRLRDGGAGVEAVRAALAPLREWLARLQGDPQG